MSADSYRRQLAKNQKIADQQREQRRKEQEAAAHQTAIQVEARRRELGFLPPAKTQDEIAAELDASLRPFLLDVLARRAAAK